MMPAGKLANGLAITQLLPNEGAKASQDTKMKVLYDDKNVYVAIQAFGTEPSKISRKLGRRDVSQYQSQCAFSGTSAPEVRNSCRKGKLITKVVRENGQTGASTSFSDEKELVFKRVI